MIHKRNSNDYHYDFLKYFFGKLEKGITVEQSFYFNQWAKLYNQLFKVDDDIKVSTV